MKALHFLEKHHLQFVDLPEPTVRENEVLLKIKKVGICGTDLHIYNGGMKVPTPLVLGHEFVGDIVKIGEKVTNISVGDRVVAEHVIGCEVCTYCREGKRNLCNNPSVVGIHRPGALAEYLAIPADLVYKLHEELSYDEGVLVEPVSIAVYAARKAGIRVGDIAAVIGQGPIGIMVDYVANASGALVIGFDRHDNRIAFAKEQQYMKHGYNTQEDGFKSRFTHHAPDGADVVFEAVGSDESASLALELARPGGRVVILGVYTHDVTINMMHVVRKELQVMGSWTSIFSVEETLQLMRSHKLATDKIITHRYTFQDSIKAFEEALADKSNRIKTIIEFE